MLPQQLFSAPPYQYPAKNVLSILPPQTATWVLTDPERNPIAWAELQVFHRRFKSAFLFVGGEFTSHLTHSDQQKGLSFLISGLTILTRPDVLTLVAPHTESVSALEDLGWGHLRELVTPLKGTCTFAKMASLSIDPHDWWQLGNAKEDQRQLTYLEKRLQPLPKINTPRWRGVTGLFRPRIDR